VTDPDGSVTPESCTADTPDGSFETGSTHQGPTKPPSALDVLETAVLGWTPPLRMHPLCHVRVDPCLDESAPPEGVPDAPQRGEEGVTTPYAVVMPAA
jgi:hypothetical protein